MMPRIVPDASVFGAAYFNEDFTLAAVGIREAIRENRVEAFAPACLRYEFLNICRKKYNNMVREIGAVKSRAALHEIVLDFIQLPIELVDTQNHMDGAWLGYVQHQIGPFDYFYIRVGMDKDAEVWFHDGGAVSNGSKIYNRILSLDKDTPSFSVERAGE